VAIVLSVIYDLRLLNYHFGILWPLCCLSSTIYGFWFTTLVSCGHCVVCHLRFTASDLPLWYMHLQTFLPIRSEKCMIKVWCFFSFLFFSIQIPTDMKENICCCNFTLYCCLIDNLHNHVHVYIKNIYMYTV
jgi:hypothetical protein